MNKGGQERGHGSIDEAIRAKVELGPLLDSCPFVVRYDVATTVSGSGKRPGEVIGLDVFYRPGRDYYDALKGLPRNWKGLRVNWEKVVPDDPNQ